MNAKGRDQARLEGRSSAFMRDPRSGSPIEASPSGKARLAQSRPLRQRCPRSGRCRKPGRREACTGPASSIARECDKAPGRELLVVGHAGCGLQNSGKLLRGRTGREELVRLVGTPRCQECKNRMVHRFFQWMCLPPLAIANAKLIQWRHMPGRGTT